MPLALDELRAGAPGPDRLADSTDRPADAPGRVDEVVPGRDDPRRVAAHVAHVGEVHAPRVAAELVAKALVLLGGEHDEDRPASRDALPDERERAGEQLIGAVVQERLVQEGFEHRRALYPQSGNASPADEARLRPWHARSS